MPLSRTGSGSERWTGTDPNLCRAVSRLVAQIDRHDADTTHEVSEVHFLKEGQENAGTKLAALAQNSGVEVGSRGVLHALLLSCGAPGDDEQAQRLLQQVLQLLETMTPPTGGGPAPPLVYEEDLRPLLNALQASILGEQHGAEVQAIAGAHAVVNIIRCSSTDPEVRLRYAQVACEEGALDLALGWLEKYANIDVAVASSCWLTTYLVQSSEAMKQLAPEAAGSEPNRTSTLLRLITGAIERHRGSEQVGEAALHALLAMAAHKQGVHSIEQEIGLEWCVAGLESCGAATGMKDAYIKLAYRIVRYKRLGMRGVHFVEQRGLQRLVGVGLTSAVDSRLKVEAEMLRSPAATDRRRSVDHSLAVAVSVVLVDTASSHDGEIVYIFEVLQGATQIWHIRKQFGDFGALDNVLRSLTSDGTHLPDLPSRWTIGKSRTAIISERGPRLRQYLEAVLSDQALQMTPALVDFFSGAETPPVPGGEESFQVGLAGTVLLLCHYPPKRDILQAEWLQTLVQDIMRMMKHNMASVLVQMVWTATLGVIASFSDGKAVVRKLLAIDQVLESMLVHRPSAALQGVGCCTLCVATRGLRAAEGHVPYGLRAVAAVLTVLTNFLHDIDVCTGACAAVWALAYRNNDVRDWSAEHGLFCTLIQVLKHHAGEVQLLSHACVAIGNLAANHRGNQDQVGEVGGIEAVVEELRLHVAAPAVCYTASSALHSALDNHEANSKRFRDCGGIALFEDIVVEHDDPKINQTVEDMMSVLMLDDPRMSRWCVFDELIEQSQTARDQDGSGILGFVKKFGGPRRPKGPSKTAVKKALETPWAFGMMREDLRSEFIDWLCDDVIYLATIEADTTVRYCTETQVQPKTGVMAMMGPVEDDVDSEDVEHGCGWPLGVEQGECWISADHPSGEEELVQAGALLLGLSASTPTRVRSGNHATRVWVIDEDAWEKVSSEMLKRELGVARLLPVLAAVPTLATLSPFQLMAVALQMTPEEYGIQDVVFAQHLHDDRGLFVVREGSVELACDWFDIFIEAKLPGQSFGMEGPLAACPRTVTATASDLGATVLRMSKATAVESLNFYRNTIDPSSTALQLLAPQLANASRPLEPTATDLLAFGALMRPLGTSRAKSEYMRGVLAFIRYCGQPITISNVLDEAVLASNVNDHQLRVDLDRENVEVDGNLMAGTEFVCSDEPAAWASQSPAGNKGLRELLVKAATARAYLTDVDTEGWVIDEVKLGLLSGLVHSVCDRTNSAGDAFVKLQEIFLTPMISITPVSSDNATQGPLRFSWDGASDYICATSENVFQITSLDPMSNDAAWFRCKCVSTGLIKLQHNDVFTRADTAMQSGVAAAAAAMALRSPSVQHLHIFVELDGNHNQRQQEDGRALIERSLSNDEGRGSIETRPSTNRESLQ